MKISFTVLGKPRGKERARTVQRGANVHTYTPRNTVSYERYIKQCFKTASPTFFTNKPVNLSVKAFYPIPKSFSLKKQKQALEGKLLPCVKPDYDNVLKVVGDALNKLAYSDDKIVVDSFFSKRYGEIPRLEIEIEEVEE